MQQRVGRLGDHVQIFALHGVGLVSSSSSAAPITPFMGVRISWLILARNWLFTRRRFFGLLLRRPKIALRNLELEGLLRQFGVELSPVPAVRWSSDALGPGVLVGQRDQIGDQDDGDAEAAGEGEDRSGGRPALAPVGVGRRGVEGEHPVADDQRA